MAIVHLAIVEGGHAGLVDNKPVPNATPGKESPYVASLGRKIQEEEFNEPTAAYLITELKRCGVHVFDVAPGSRDVPLIERTNTANRIYNEYKKKYGASNVKAIYISIHYNALLTNFAGSNAAGYSAHIYPGHKNKDAGKLANLILAEIKATSPKQINRGVVEQDLHVNRETAMPAVLTENGFMDDEAEALKMIDVNYQRTRAIAHAKGACKYFGIPYVAAPVPKPTPAPAATYTKTPEGVVVGLHRVKVNGAQVGAFKELDGIISTVKDGINRAAKKIEIERV